MTSNTLQSPEHKELADFISEAHSSGDVATIFATCSVKFTGNRDGEIGEGDRVIICKADGAIAVHRPTSARGVAWQGVRSTVEAIPLDDTLLIYGSKSQTDTIRIEISNTSLAVRYDATDNAVLHENQTEEQMHEFILSNPEKIEEGFRIIEHEKKTPHGRIDFYGADADGNNVIIEVKQPVAKFSHVDQLNRYVSHFRRSEAAAVRGILVAPSIKSRVRGTLRDSNLEWVELKGYRKRDTAPGQTSIDAWE